MSKIGRKRILTDDQLKIANRLSSLFGWSSYTLAALFEINAQTIRSNLRDIEPLSGEPQSLELPPKIYVLEFLQTLGSLNNHLKNNEKFVKCVSKGFEITIKEVWEALSRGESNAN